VVVYCRLMRRALVMLREGKLNFPFF
jgi:hypothetical protein